jgi:4-amino-4-deoxy-L-arabinose transferase-like glycosyltransferase
MKTFAILLGVLGYTIFLIVGISAVPFHPDETSLLLQSRDFDLYLADPSQLAWSPEREGEQEQIYRALNAPLPKYVLGLARRLGGFTAAEVPVDWDWSEDFAQNVDRGALPSDEMLLAARLGSTLLLPLALYFVYRSGDLLGGPRTGWLAVAVLGLNSLFLLHGRRAMAEGVLFFGLAIALWSLFHADRQPVLAGIAIGLAFAAKHSALPLIAIGVLAAGWIPGPAIRWRARIAGVARFLAGLAVVSLVLNPFLWSDPIRAGIRSWDARRSLVQDQIQMQAIAEHVAIELPMRPSDQLSAFLGQVYFSPAQSQEAGNYEQALASSIEAYLGFAGHTLLRGWLVGSLAFGLSLFGMLLALVRLRRGDPVVRRRLILLLLTSAGIALALLLGIPFPFQRYYVPMLPIVTLWVAYAVGSLIGLTRKLLSERAALN